MASPPPQSPQQSSPQQSQQDPQQSDDRLIAGVAALLLIGASASATATAIFKISGIPVDAVAGALTAIGFPVSMPRPAKAKTALSVTKSANRMYRAAFVVNASRRIWTAIKTGKPLGGAVLVEKQRWGLHLKATARRLLVARGVDGQVDIWGPTLGWYSVMDARTSPECRAANGRNFTLTDPPVIGWPGAVHMWCRCTPGRPWPGAKMVNGSLTVTRSDGASGFYPGSGS